MIQATGFQGLTTNLKMNLLVFSERGVLDLHTGVIELLFELDSA